MNNKLFIALITSALASGIAHSAESSSQQKDLPTVLGMAIMRVTPEIHDQDKQKYYLFPQPEESDQVNPIMHYEQQHHNQFKLDVSGKGDMPRTFFLLTNDGKGSVNGNHSPLSTPFVHSVIREAQTAIKFHTRLTEIPEL